ncbi:MAG: response regulator [Deltaproteobacteria bacterium]|nr:response regulator [Deltaproteobacteria bacterium]
MRNIAVVDDDAAERRVLKGLLEESGFKVVAEGASGVEAIEICRTKPPDLIIMDVKMPGKDGIEAAFEIDRLSPVPVILLTAHDDDETIRRAIEAGVMGYLLKPVKLEDIKPAVELAVSRFREFRLLSKEVTELKSALAARKAVEKAKGLLMEKEGLTEQEAFARLRKISMDRRKSMGEIAEIVILALEDKK